MGFPSESDALTYLFNKLRYTQVVDKSTIEVGSADDIRNKLSSFVKDNILFANIKIKTSQDIY